MLSYLIQPFKILDDSLEAGNGKVRIPSHVYLSPTVELSMAMSFL